MNRLSVSWAGILWLAACVSVAAAYPFTICDNAPASPLEVTLTPNPAVFGEELKVAVEFEPEPVREGGTFEFAIFIRVPGIFWMRPSYEEIDAHKRDLCNYIKCPIEGDVATLVYTRDLPAVGKLIGGVGTYKLRVKVKDLTGSLVSCFELEMKIDASEKHDEHTLNLLTEDLIQKNA